MEPEIKALLEKQGETFSAFKSTVNDLDAEVKRMKGDVVTND